MKSDVRAAVQAQQPKGPGDDDAITGVVPMYGVSPNPVPSSCLLLKEASRNLPNGRNGTFSA